MNKDLLSKHYGRFYHIPKYLAEKGHQVHILLLNYKRSDSVDTISDGMHWHSVSIFTKFGFEYYLTACQLIKRHRLDWIFGFSDVYFGIIANHLSKKYRIHSLIDAYDNYESYIPWLKPVHILWRRALKQADLVTAAGPTLQKLLGKDRPDKPTMILPMAADPQFSSQLDKEICRKKLGLSTDKPVIGYCGGIHQNRGISQLFSAFNILRQMNPEIEFVVSGRLFPNIELPDYIKWLGYLDDDLLPCLIRSLDVLVSVNLESDFGNYSYPVKIYEAMQSNVAVVATSTPSVDWVLEGHEDLLAPASNPAGLAVTISRALNQPDRSYNFKGNWQDHTQKLEQAMISLNNL